MKKVLLSALMLMWACASFAQNADIDPVITPTFFGPNDQITVTYDVTGTPLQSLTEAWIWVWVPSSNFNAVSNVNPATSNTALTNAAKFTRTTGASGEVFFSITLTPATFFTPAATDIEQMGMLIKGDDWANGQSGDYIASITNGFVVRFSNPSEEFGIYSTVSDVTFSAEASQASDIQISVDGQVIASETAVTEISTSHTVLDDGNVHIVTVTADNGAETASDIYSYTFTPSPENAPVPAGMQDGINYHADNTSATLVLTAPNKEHVFILGDFNDWTISSDFLMKKDGEKWWLTLDGLTEGEEYIYQYFVDGRIRIADPYAEKVSSQFDDAEIISDGRYPNLRPYPNGKTTEAAGYLQTGQSDFEWADFTPPAKKDLMIYELLIRDFTEERTYQAVTDRLDYLQDLGINALQLMPVMEFEGNISWGYNPSSMFAVDKYYGTELDLKTLINECHKRGMAVILDIVLNHQFNRNSLVRLYNQGVYGDPTSDNPWFNTVPKHDFNVGSDMNHDSQYTQDYSKRVMKYWIEEYNIDGYRFDLSKGFTQKNSLGNVGLWGQFDQNRVALWKEYADYIWSIDPDSYVILEHFADNSEEKELAAYGMMLWGNMNHTYRNAAKGASTSLGGMYHGNREFVAPHLIGYMESHDEERVMWDVLKTKSLDEALERAKIAAVFTIMVPGPKMIWQFGEFGYDEELNNDRLGIKPTHWEYLDDPARQKLFKLYTALINLRTKTQYVSPNGFEWNTSGWIKTINTTHPEVDIYIAANFDNRDQNANHKFSKTGTWYDFFTGESFEVTDADAEYTLAPSRFFIYTSTLIDNYITDGTVSSLREDLEDQISVYPNPAKNLVRIHANGMVITEVKIMDITGKQIKTPALQADGVLDVSHLQTGIYLLHVGAEGKTVTKTMVIK